MIGCNRIRFIFTWMALLSPITHLHVQWEILNQGTSGSLNTIDFVSENIGWVNGEEGILYKTEDRGETWRSLPLDENRLVGLFDFINEFIGWGAFYEREAEK